MLRALRVTLVAGACLLMGVPAGRAAVRPPATASGAEDVADYAPRDITILVDVSRSMDDIFDRVRAALTEFVDNARPQDRLTLVAFSDGATVVQAWRVSAALDRDRLKKEIASLRPHGRFTNITSALRRGVSLLHDVRAEEADAVERVRFVLLITDGRHNPPNRGRAPSFDDVLHRYSDFRPGQDWFIHYITVRNVTDDETLAFVRAAGGQVSLLNEERLGELASRMDQLELAMPVAVADAVGPVSVIGLDGQTVAATAGRALLPGEKLITGPYARAVLRFGALGAVGVDPDSRVELERAFHNPVRRSHHVALWVPYGRVCGQVHGAGRHVAFDVKTPTGHAVARSTIFFADVDQAATRTHVGVLEGTVDVRSLDDTGTRAVGPGTTAAAESGGTVTEPAPLDGALRREWDVWRRALVEGRALHALAPRFVAARWEGLSAEVGPLAPGETTEQHVVFEVGELAGQPLAAEIVSAKVPPGVRTSAALHLPPAEAADQHAILTLAASAVPDFRIRYNREYRAKVRLSGPTLSGDLAPVFTVHFVTGPRPTEVTIGVAASGDTPRPGTAPVEVWWSVAGAAVGGPLVVLGLVYWWNRGRTALPLGRLLLVCNPAPARWRASVVDLERIAMSRTVRAITLGRARQNHVVLPDPSIQPEHAELRVTGRGRANRRVFLHARPGAEVYVNDECLEGPVELLDRMRIRLGGFEFLYEDTQYYEQVEVAMRDRHVRRGVLHSWDLTRPEFLLAPEDIDLKQRETAEEVIRYSDVEDITVFRPRVRGRQNKRSARAHGSEAFVRMTSGRSHRGWLRRDYDPEAPRFYFFPARADDVDYMIIERQSVAQIDIADPHLHAAAQAVAGRAGG